MVNEASTADETVAILTSTADEDMADCRERGVHAADKATGTFASTLDEAAKAPSIADEASTADKAVAILASTTEEAIAEAEAVSTADETSKRRIVSTAD